MAENNLRKLNRAQLLDMLLEVSKENEALHEENEYLKHLLNDRRIVIDRAGTIAEAAFEMNNVLQAAQDAADQYLNNVRIMTEQQERELTQKRADIERELQEHQDALEKEISDRRTALEKEIQDGHAALEKELYDKRIVLEQETWDLCRGIERDTIAKCQQTREKTRRECEQMVHEAEARCRQLENK